MRAMRICERAVLFPIERTFPALRIAVLLLAALCLGVPASDAAAQFAPGKPRIPGFAPPVAAAAEAEPDEVLTVAAAPAADRASPGADVPIALTFTFAPGWHMWPQKGASIEGLAVFSGAIPTVLSVAKGADGQPAEVPGVDLNLAFAQWPELHVVEMNLGDGPQKYAVHEGAFTVFVPASIRPDAAPGVVEIPFSIRFQACDDQTCQPPTSIEAVARLTIEPGATMPAPGAAFASFDPSIYGKVRAGEAQGEVLERPQRRRLPSPPADRRRGRAPPQLHAMRPSGDPAQDHRALAGRAGKPRQVLQPRLRDVARRRGVLDGPWRPDGDRQGLHEREPALPGAALHDRCRRRDRRDGDRHGRLLRHAAS
jgi:hypothetical protein